MARERARTVLVARGAWGSVEAVVTSSGAVSAGEFLVGLDAIREKSKAEPQATAQARFLVLFQQMANAGQVSPKRFGPEPEGLHAFKHEVRNIQIRFPCFRDGNRWILTHGFMKPGAKKGLGRWPQAGIDRAVRIRREYEQTTSTFGRSAP